MGEGLCFRYTWPGDSHCVVCLLTKHVTHIPLCSTTEPGALLRQLDGSSPSIPLAGTGAVWRIRITDLAFAILRHRQDVVGWVDLSESILH